MALRFVGTCKAGGIIATTGSKCTVLRVAALLAIAKNRLDKTLFVGEACCVSLIPDKFKEFENLGQTRKLKHYSVYVSLCAVETIVL